MTEQTFEMNKTIILQEEREREMLRGSFMGNQNKTDSVLTNKEVFIFKSCHKVSKICIHFYVSIFVEKKRKVTLELLNSCNTFDILWTG